VALIGADGADGIGVPVGGTTGQALIKSSNTDYDTEWGTVASSPGGSDTQVQFNDGGVFGGDAGLTFNKTAKTITLGGGTVTTSSPVIDAAQTWNAGGVTFTGLKFNATDTASAAGSLLMDLQVGGTSRFSVSKAGNVVIANNGTLTGYRFRAATSGVARAALDTWVGDNNGYVLINSTGALIWTSSADAAGTGDLFLTRRAAANLRFGAADAAAPVAQTLSAQSVAAGTTNTAGANLTITGSQGTGTGAGGSIIFQVAPAGSSGTAQNALATFLEATSARAFNLYNTADVTTNFERAKIAWSSNVLQIGTEKAGTGTARALHLQTDGVTRLTISTNDNFIFGSTFTDKAFVFPNVGYLYGRGNGILQLANASDGDFDRLQFGGTTSSFPALKRSTTVLQAVLADDTGFATIQGKLRADVNAVAETPVATHTITITDAAGTAYKVLCVAA
jgi:hypothetical protein